MILEGFKLIILGMVIVYVFLIVLLGLISLSAKTLKNRVSATPSKGSYSTRKDNDLIAVLSASISAYRKKNLR